MAHRSTSWKSSQRNAGSACLGTRRLPRLPPILPSRTRISTRRSPSTRVQGHRCVSIKRMSTQICIALIDMSPRLLGFPAQGHDGSAPPPLTPLPHAPRSGLKKKEKQGLKRELFLQRAQPCHSILPPGGGGTSPIIAHYPHSHSHAHSPPTSLPSLSPSDEQFPASHRVGGVPLSILQIAQQTAQAPRAGADRGRARWPQERASGRRTRRRPCGSPSTSACRPGCEKCGCRARPPPAARPPRADRRGQGRPAQTHPAKTSPVRPQPPSRSSSILTGLRRRPHHAR